jgi:type II secretory pathway component PulF
MNNMANLFKKISKGKTASPRGTATTSSAVAPTLFLSFRTKDQVLFAKRLSFLMKAGVGILESISIIRDQTKSKRLRRVFDAVVADVSAGQFLSRSLLPYQQLFGAFTINMIRVGENAGVLPENLIYLADELSKKSALERKVRGALIYPIFITVATLGVTGMLVVYIFPKIMPIFISLNVKLPWTTKALLGVSTYLSHWGFVTLVGVVFIFVIFEAVRRSYEPLHYAVDWLILKLPVVGPIARAYNCANFCRTLSLNLKSGIHLSEAMTITANITHNLIYKRAYQDFTEYIMRGERVSAALARYRGIFPDMLPHLILIGETTGSLGFTLEYLSELYESEVDEATKNLSNSIEPILLMVMGAIVGLIAVSVIAPIYEVTKYIGNGR